jgi:hypothetical protein
MNDNKEKLNELLSDFFDPAEASQIKRDIEQGDEVFRNYPAPEPNKELVDAIKVRMADELARRRERKPVSVVLRRAVAVAAVFIFISLAGLIFFGNGDDDIYANIWQDDTQLLALMAQVDEIADQIQQIRLDEFVEDNGTDIAQWEIEEMEMVANNTDFWKG